VSNFSRVDHPHPVISRFSKCFVPTCDGSGTRFHVQFAIVWFTYTWMCLIHIGKVNLNL